MTFNPSKALIALVGLVCITILLSVGKLETSEGVPILTMIIGYSIGNGMAALTNKEVQPIIRKKDSK
jgi:hypothetical protein